MVHDMKGKCDVCKTNPASHTVRPWNNPAYALLEQCDECKDSRILYKTF